MAMQGLSITMGERNERRGSIALVLLVAAGLVAAAAGLMMVGRNQAGSYVMFLLAVLGVIGVFSLFALAAGVLRVSARGTSNAILAKRARECLRRHRGDRRRRAGALRQCRLSGVRGARPGRRTCARSSGCSSAIPMSRRRSIACSRPPRRGGGCRRRSGSPGARGEPARWLRLRVRPLGAVGASDGTPSTSVWTVADVTRDRERQENVFQELQHAIDYLDHAPAGFFSVDGAGDIGYINATLAGWLDYDLAQVGSGGLRLADILPGDQRGAAHHAVGASGRGEDRDPRSRSAPPRRPHAAGAALSQGGVRGRRHARRVAHPGAQPRRRRRRRSAARRRSALHALLQQHPDGDRDRRPQRPHRAQQCAVRPPVPERAQGRGGAAAGPLDPRRHRRARPRRARRGAGAGRGRPRRHRADRCGARRRGRALGAFLRHPGRGSRARFRGRDRLCHRDHRAAGAAAPVRPVAEDGVGRQARRRHRA